MMRAAVVSSEAMSGSLLRASLLQTGLVSSVREWSGNEPPSLGPGEAAPDIVLLDIHNDAEALFAIASGLRRSRPAIRVIACAEVAQPDSQLLLKAMRSGVQEFFPKPINPVHLREVLLRFVQERDSDSAESVDKLILVLGSKGGVGTSTVTVNLAAQLAQASKKRVVLLDMARPIGHVGVLLDIQSRFTLRDTITNMDRLDSHFFAALLTRHSSGLDVLAGTTEPDEWEGINPAMLARVASVAQGVSDYVLIDGGVCPSAAWEPLFHMARAIVLVSEAKLLSLWGLQHRVAGFAALNLDPSRIRIIINRWQRSDEESLSKVEKNIKHPIFARIPNDYASVTRSESLGVPLSGNHSNPLVTKYRQLACQLAGAKHSVEPKKGGLAGLLSFQPKKV